MKDESRHNSKILIVAAVIASVVTVASVASVTVIAINDAGRGGEGAGHQGSKNQTIASTAGTVHALDSQMHKTDIVMPTKVSRPGCEDKSICYIPFEHTAYVDSPITWTNNDSAFHTVTSGSYDDPIDMFDSGYMDPYDSYTLSFGVPGTYNYYCTLHPWMEGVIMVSER